MKAIQMDIKNKNKTKQISFRKFSIESFTLDFSYLFESVIELL